jgi:SAM-dependent methyltransferase
MKLEKEKHSDPAPPGAEGYAALDEAFLAFDKKLIRRTRNIQLIPEARFRRGGKLSYAEWAHVIGIFQTLIYMHLGNKQSSLILDVGCGTGLLAVASHPFLGDNGKYLGIDVSKKYIEFCRAHYPGSGFEFIHLETDNAYYSPGKGDKRLGWPIESNTVDLTTALSVWTHFNEGDATFYLKEINRVLKPGGKAIVSFFLLDDLYRTSVGNRSGQAGKYHTMPQNRWIFDQPSYGSTRCFHPSWADVPEQAIGLTREGLDFITDASGLKLIEHHNGSWKEVPGIFFQDVMVFQKEH